MRTGLQLVRQNQSAPNKAAYIDVEEILDILANAKTQFGKTGGRHIMQQIGRRLHHGLYLGNDIDITPSCQCAGRQVHLVLLTGQCARHGDACTKDTRAQSRRQRGNQFGKPGADQRQR